MKPSNTPITFPFWHKPGSGYWHFYTEPRRSVCGNWHLIDQPLPTDATKRMPSRHTGKVCVLCERNRP